jgi:hypothetical protein
VRSHVRSLFRKTGVHSREELLETFRGVSARSLEALAKRRTARQAE